MRLTIVFMIILSGTIGVRADDTLDALNRIKPGDAYASVRSMLIAGGWLPVVQGVQGSGTRCENAPDVCARYGEAVGCWTENAVVRCSMNYIDIDPAGSELWITVRLTPDGDVIYETYDEQVKGGRG